MRQVNDEPAKRRYASLRRATQAQETRADIAHAARALFLDRGWAATTVRDVAAAAGVSVPTVYAAYGSKAGLAQALVDAVALTADRPHLQAELESATAPRAQLAAMVAFDRRLFERAGDVIVLVREAGRAEPDLAGLYREGRAGADEVRRQVFGTWPAGTLRSGVDIAEAVDVYAALCNVDAFATLTGERGWSPAKVEWWWRDVLTRELLG
jgi:TetR/AcrR family transcriptional regulator, regulator of cefoperazone and chloramphenicol sensitivity